MENLFSGKWTDIKGEVLKAWSSLTQEELDLTGGSLQSVVTLLQEKFGLAREEAATRLMELAAAIEGDQARPADQMGASRSAEASVSPAKNEPTKH